MPLAAMFVLCASVAQDYSIADSLKADDAPLPSSLASDLQDEDFGRRSRGPESDFGLRAGIHGRWSAPFGSAGRDISGFSSPGGTVIVVDQHISWGDFFSPGWGWDLELDIMIGKQRDMGNAFRYGFYIAVLEDQYAGRKVSDDLGASINAGDMSMASLLVGGKVVNVGKGWEADGRMGIGAVHYSEVSGIFNAPAVTQFNALLFEDTWTFAMELRGHGALTLGPVALQLGMGFRLMAPPNAGSLINLNSGLMFTFDLEIGLEIGF
jgi:hypothetical protein